MTTGKTIFISTLSVSNMESLLLVDGVEVGGNAVGNLVGCTVGPSV
jgi:hypothetical protein